MDNLRKAIEKMDIVTVDAGIKYSGLSRKAILDFIHKNPHLRIFDEQAQHWINENVDGHC
ncbi:hypothetical protein ACFSJM_11585 [Lactococcus formosensis subsp. bovis]|uniref:hypothetical protein n=1 Tax=Lactococcus formosensis TaxID=1281486 RepID=UPI001BCED078|nr:hypothetical protein [Lactococcus formosensis]